MVGGAFFSSFHRVRDESLWILFEYSGFVEMDIHGSFLLGRN